MHFLGRAAALLIALAATPAPAAEQPSTPYLWRNVKIGAGGFAPNIIFSPAEKGLAYLRTDVGGAYRWDAREQRWVPLQDGMWQTSYSGVESIAPDPKDPNVVYVAGGMYDFAPAAILRSADRGATWQITQAPFKMGGNEDGRGMGERLAVDPNRTSTLLFGSRHAGLWRSDDSAKTWRKVDGFPWPGLGTPNEHQTHAGVPFVLFDPESGSDGTGSKVIYAGVADPAAQHLFRSSDGGRTWAAVADGPPSNMLPTKAAIDPHGVLYVDYGTGIGPNDIEDGAVWKLDTRTGTWADISPVRGSEAEGGYMGLSLDRQHPGRLAVSTVDRWNHKDTVWLSDDSGAHWTSLRERSTQDVTATPYVKFGDPKAPFGHWISGLGFDPFDGGTLAYTTGVTVYRTRDVGKAKLVWRPWVEGEEETVPLSLTSPPTGAHLVSGIGDVHGFVHDRLDVSPARSFDNPKLPNTNNIDYAGLAPNVLVRSASPYQRTQEGVSLGWSDDGGHSWHQLAAPAVAGDAGAPARIDANGDAPITVSADGRTFVVSGPVMFATADRGRSWWKPTGLPADARAVADKVAPAVWHAADYRGARLFISTDGARTFHAVAAAGLPAQLWDPRMRSRETPPFLVARTGVAGELWMLAQGRLYRSTDFGRSFATAGLQQPIFKDMSFLTFGLGKAAPGASVPAIYAFGVTQHFGGIYRSIDGGANWTRINDDAHQWGLRYRVMTGDPRIFGRVYVGTDGRGIFYGDAASGKALR